MKPAAIGTASWLVILLAGCAQPQAPQSPAARRLSARGPLDVTLTVPKARVAGGQRFDATLTAVNRGETPLTIPASSTAPVYLRLWRWTGFAWEQFKQIPQASPILMQPWKLQPGQAKTFLVGVEITPDWPTAERIRMTAELNGRPDVVDSVFLIVEPHAPDRQ